MHGSEPLPTRIAHYRIIGLLGEGAMGRVYLAEEAQPARRVALKVLRTAALGPDALARFRRESELLASLVHPAIARLYAAGTDETAAGRVSWLAMELVDGTDLLDYAASRQLDVGARLRLMVEVCRAVHYAHSRGIVHRDLKPANVLVDDNGAPHVLDFGVAHVASADETLTRTGEVLGTVPYMSPEQLEGRMDRVDPRSDVYALGVIAYQLLTDRLPYPGLDQASLVGALRLVREQRPVRLSALRADARGDLETIVMKALSGEPAQRYGSAAEFAGDLERYLASQPIEARPPTVRYVLSLFVRRHRALAASAALAAVALIASAVVSLNFALAEARARADADARAAEATAVNDFLERMLASADPDNARGRAVTVREIVDDARLTLGAARNIPASVRTQLKQTLGITYLGLGEFDTALSLLGEARAAAEAEGEPALADELRVAMGAALQEKGDYAAAETLLTPMVRAPLPAYPNAMRIRLAAEQTRIQVIALAGRQEEALALLRELHPRASATLGANDERTASIGSDLATVLRDLGDVEAAATLAAEVWDARRASLGDDHPDTLLSLNLLGAVDQARGDHESALARFTEVAAARERVLGEKHVQTLTSLQNLAAVYVSLGRPAEALPILERITEPVVEHFGPTHTRSFRLQNIYAYALEDVGRLDEAETVFRRIVAAQDEIGAEHPENLAHYNNLAMLLMKKGGFDEAVSVFERLLPETAALVGDAHPYYLIFESNYGDCLTRLGRHEHAVSALEHAHTGLVAVAGAAHPRTVTAAERLATAYRALGRDSDAAALTP